MKMTYRTFLLLLLLSLVITGHAQTAVDVSGHWEGNIQSPLGEVSIEVDLAKKSNGELTGIMSAPSQRLKGLYLSNFSVKDNSVGFKVNGAPGERVFSGVVSVDGKSISGDYTQGGFTMPFTLTRTGEAMIETPPKSAPVGKELEGTWNGKLETSGGLRRQLVLTLSNQLDGTANGNIFNVEEGLEIPIATIAQKGSSLTLDLKAVNASYVGTLNTEGTELAGTLIDGPVSLPLAFRRASK